MARESVISAFVVAAALLIALAAAIAMPPTSTEAAIARGERSPEPALGAIEQTIEAAPRKPARRADPPPVDDTAEQADRIRDSLRKLGKTKAQRALGSASLGSYVHDADIPDEVVVEAFHRVRAVQSQVDLFRAQHSGRTPWSSGEEILLEQWTPLIGSAYLGDAPANPLSPANSATRIEAFETGAFDGRHFNPEHLGWVWSLDTDTILLAGFANERFDVGLKPREGLLPILEGTLNDAIAAYQLRFRVSPFKDRELGWAKLIEMGKIEASPHNPLSPELIDTMIFVTDDPEVTGETISPRQAGWVWNEATGTLHASVRR
ncbi:MAG: hypothetical protein AAGD00_03290 [Planctomycetota bacterium]